LWKYTYDVNGEPWIMASEPVIGDLNDDGVPEIAFTTYSVDQGVSHLTILDDKGRMQRKAVLDKRGAMSSPALADVDGDGKLDILVSLKDVVGVGKGGVQIWTVASAGGAKPAWPMARGNSLRTGIGGTVQGGTVRLRKAPHGLRNAVAKSARKGFDALGKRAPAGPGGTHRVLLAPPR
jgi:hypothetical protein